MLKTGRSALQGVSALAVKEDVAISLVPRISSVTDQRQTCETHTAFGCACSLQVARRDSHTPEKGALRLGVRGTWDIRVLCRLALLLATTSLPPFPSRFPRLLRRPPMSLSRCLRCCSASTSKLPPLFLCHRCKPLTLIVIHRSGRHSFASCASILPQLERQAQQHFKVVIVLLQTG